MAIRLPSLCSALALPVLAFAGCGVQGSGVSAEETRTVASFAAVNAEGVADLELVVDPDANADEIELTISGDDNFVEMIATSVSGGKLVVEMPDHMGYYKTMPLRVTATVASLHSLEASGSVGLNVEGLDEEELTVRLSGSSDVSLSGTTEKLALHASGSSDIALSGATQELVLETSGSSKILAKELTATNVSVASSGSSDIEVCVTGSLDIDASGSADITYFCNPDDVQSNVSGSANVNKGE